MWHLFLRIGLIMFTELIHKKNLDCNLAACCSHDTVFKTYGYFAVESSEGVRIDSYYCKFLTVASTDVLLV